MCLSVSFEMIPEMVIAAVVCVSLVLWGKILALQSWSENQ